MSTLIHVHTQSMAPHLLMAGSRNPKTNPTDRNPVDLNPTELNLTVWRIRPARPEEADALSDLAFRSKAHWGYDDDFMAGCKAELSYTAQQIASERFRFAVAVVTPETGKAQLLGFYALAVQSPASEAIQSQEIEPDTIEPDTIEPDTIEPDTIEPMEMEALFVAPEAIGQGVGRALFLHAKQAAAKLGAHALVIQSDPNAEGFYRAMGGVLVGKQESASIPGRYLPLLAVDLFPVDLFP